MLERKNQKMKKASTVYVIDLTKIEGNGDFLCPNCGTVISPDDETETTYVIQEVQIKKKAQLEELVIKCINCGSIIHITGFTSL